MFTLHFTSKVTMKTGQMSKTNALEVNEVDENRPPAVYVMVVFRVRGDLV